MQRQQMWLEDAERGDHNPSQRQQSGNIGQRYDASDDGGRGQHDRDLKGGGAELEMMVFGGREIPLFLCMLGALGKLLGPLASLGLGAVARRGLLPVVDLLLRRRLGGIVAG